MDDHRDLGVTGQATAPLEIAIAAWLHAKQQKSQSRKTITAYASILAGFRARLQAQGIDLDAADPHRQGDATTQSDRTIQLALIAQAFAAEPVITELGTRPVAPATANLRLAALSSFYTYALRQGLLEGPNPIMRVERHKVQAYAHAQPINYDTLAAALNAIDITMPKGLRDWPSCSNRYRWRISSSN